VGIAVALLVGCVLTFAAQDELRFRRVFGPALQNQVRVQNYVMRSRAPSEERFMRTARIAMLGTGALFIAVGLVGIAARLL
jgi:hypothetical protein